MAHLEFCSNCGKKNSFGLIDGNKRYHCVHCNTIHYENPKPTATIVCFNDESILLAKRAYKPAKGEWGLPGGFLELNETLQDGALRELKEETNLEGDFINIIGTCSHYGSIFGDILLIGVHIHVYDYSHMRAGDDAEEIDFFSINNLPEIAFDCHAKIISKFIRGI